MRTERGGLAETLWPVARRRVLGLLLLDPDRELHLREIARRTKLSASTVQREVAGLTEAGILARRREGSQVYYRADPSCPIFGELSGIILKTAGLADVLRRCLESVRDRVQVAFVFGSLAGGHPTGGSDVDLMVVGDVSLRELVPHLRDARESLGREINPVVMGARELRTRMGRQDRFLGDVMEGPVIPVIGGRDEVEQLAAVGPTAEA